MDHARPYVLLSAAMSIDGYLDDASEIRLLLSNDGDFDRVDGLRAGCDAILVGANTVRRDNPRLVVRSATRRRERVTRGQPETPAKVTITARGDLDPTAAFFTAGETAKLVYCGSSAVTPVRERLGSTATVVDAGEPISLSTVVGDLAARGVERLLVEGGGLTLTAFLTAGLADELQLVVAPFFVGDARAPRLVADGVFPWHPGRRATLAEIARIDDVALLRYALSERYSGSAMPGDEP